MGAKSLLIPNGPKQFRPPGKWSGLKKMTGHIIHRAGAGGAASGGRKGKGKEKETKKKSERNRTERSGTENRKRREENKNGPGEEGRGEEQTKQKQKQTKQPVPIHRGCPHTLPTQIGCVQPHWLEPWSALQSRSRFHGEGRLRCAARWQVRSTRRKCW